MPAVVCHASLCLVDDISGAFIIFIHPTLEGEMNEDKASGRNYAKAKLILANVIHRRS